MPRDAVMNATAHSVSPITHAELDLALSELRFGVDASDLHGSLIGFLCEIGRAHV